MIRVVEGSCHHSDRNTSPRPFITRNMLLLRELVHTRIQRHTGTHTQTHGHTHTLSYVPTDSCKAVSEGITVSTF